MKNPSVYLLAAIVGIVRGQIEVEGFVCDIPTDGCTNGMFNQAMCECECISPFCPDSISGNCMNPSDNCGGNPWTECTRGVNCPWWENPLKAESCTTGPTVPVGLWKIYNTRTACCNTNYAYSNTCDVKPKETLPTKFPTIAAPEDDVFEVVPIKFDIQGLPDDIRMRDLKDEMTTVLKRILLRLSNSINGLKISSVEERVVLTRDLMKKKSNNLIRRHNDHYNHRDLAQDVTVYFNVYVIRDDDKKFGPLIINEIRDSYDEVLGQIQQFTDTRFIGVDLDMNWCTSQNGKFELCVKEVPKSDAGGPGRPPPPSVIVLQGDPPPEEDPGMAGWAIALIIIFVLLLLVCIGYFIFLYCFQDDRRHNSRDIQNNVYFDDKSRASGYTSRGGSRGYDDDYYDEKSRRRGGSGRSVSSRSRTSRVTQSRQLVLVAPENKLLVVPEGSGSDGSDDSFTVNTRGTRGTKHTNKSRRTHGSRRTQGTKRTQSSKRRVPRDPTMYVPGQENKPDPDNDNVLMIENGGADDASSGRRYYAEDPPLKPKRDPTMYVKGNHSAEDPPLKPKRDPTLYVEGQQDPSMYVEGQQDPSIYVEGQQDPSMYVEGQKDPSMYVEGQQDPSMYAEGGKEPTMYSEASVEEMYSDDIKTQDDDQRFGMEDIEEVEEEYDRYGFKQDSNYNESEEQAVLARGMGRDPTHYDGSVASSPDEASFNTHSASSPDEASFHTRDPSISSNTGTAKSPKKSSKRSSRQSRKNGDGLRKSLQSNWGTSMPDVGGGGPNKNMTDAQRQTKSFYN